jgi:hypothetical protein
VFRALLCWAAGIVQIIGSVDEGKVGQRLRKIAEKPIRIDVKLFREEADVVADIEQAFEYAAGLVIPALQDEIVHKPE